MGERKVWLTENTGLGWRTADWNVDRDSSGLSVLHNKVNTFIGPLNPTGQHMYRTVVTVCTAQWSPYVPHSGHYMYRTVITIYTAQWSLYVPHSGHYMYRTVVTICTAQWSLYVPYSGHYMYHQFNIQELYVLPTQLYLCVLCGSQNKQPLFPYTSLTDWFL